MFFKNKQLKQELLEANQKLSSLEQVRDSLDSEMLVLKLTSQGEVVYANSNFLQEMLFVIDRLIGKVLFDLVPQYAQSAGHFKLMKSAIQKGEHWAGALQMMRGNDDEAWLRAIVQPIKDISGKVVHVSVYASDLTRTIEASREHQNLIEALQRSTAVIEFDLDGMVLTANDRFLSAMGYSLPQLMGQHHKVFCEPEEYKSAQYELFWEKLRRGEYIADR